MRQNHRIETLVSAGGLVYRIRKGKVEFVVCGLKSTMTWSLPKGTPEAGENRKQTAIRETNEETGLEVEIEDFVGATEYKFSSANDGIIFHKTVLFYLMVAIGGDLSLHDDEFDVVKWIPAEDALKILTYDNEVRIVEKGLFAVSQK